jgi:divalent metal cation (Fe/Co/Zn/Cd) transporter
MDPEARKRLREVIRSFPEVEHIARIMTMHLGPEDVLVTADVQVRDGLRTEEIEVLMERLNRRVSAELPEVRETFIELHSSDPRQRLHARVGPPRHG